LLRGQRLFGGRIGKCGRWHKQANGRGEQAERGRHHIALSG
jgi:hypothetical protein